MRPFVLAAVLLAATSGVTHARAQPPPAPQPPAPPPPAPPDDEDDDDDDDDDEDDGPRAPADEGPRQTQKEIDEARREEAAQAGREKARPRPALVDVVPPEPPPWERHLEVGASIALVIRPFANALGESEIGYQPGPGLGVHLHWPIVSWLRFHPYFVLSTHLLDIPQGALQSGTPLSIGPNATISESSVTAFVFGAKLAPTLNITDRLRGWVAVGVGWGRFSFPEMTVTEPNGATFLVRSRAGVLVEFPLGLGIAFDVIERWLEIEYEATAAPVTGQSGNAHEVFQAVDADGNIRDVGPFGAIEVSFVQTLGLSIIF
jgi:hypothetical protein